MRLTLYALILAFAQSYALSGYAQETKLNLKMENSSVREVLLEIENISEFRFLYNSKMVDVDRKVSVNFKEQTIDKALNKLFKNTGAAYRIIDRQVVLYAKSEPVLETVELQQQQRTVSGKVTDIDSQPLPGVSIVIKGTTQGTVTNINGEYSLANLPSDAILIFSFVGMKTQEIAVGTRTNIDIRMEEETIGIEEVVAVGYGTQKKINLTGAVSAVSSKVLESRPIANIGQGLQGTISNLNITENSGTIGVGPSINIRGYESINGGEPLILVNNVPMNINMINPNDIESISVLKDAASAAIYGARAAYGVILITTKSGKKSDKPLISLTTNYSINTPTYRLKLMDSKEFCEYMNIAGINQNGRAYFPDHRTEAIMAHYNDPSQPTAYPNPSNPSVWLSCANTDWMEWLQRDYYPQQSHTASVSGGTEKINYYSSLGYFNQKGIAKQFDEKYERYNIIADFNYDIFKWANIGSRISIITSNKRYTPDTRTGLPEEYTPMNVNLRSIDSVYWPDGNYGSAGSIPNMVQFHRDAGYRNREQEDIWMTGFVKLTPLKNTTFNLDYSVNRENKEELNYYKKMPLYNVFGQRMSWLAATNPSRVLRTYYHNRFYIFNAYADYENEFGKHYVKILLGFNQENNVYRNFTSQREQLLIDSMPYMSLANGEQRVSDAEREYSIRGAFFRLNYNFHSRYFLELNNRYDGTSKFPKDDRFEFFPSISLGWRIENDFPWLKKSFDMMKLRLSYGNLGNQNVADNYPYIASYDAGYAGFVLGEEDPITILPPGLVSPTLTWETVTQWDLGLDISLWNNMMNASFDIYRRDTKNMLTKSQTLPAVLATNEPQENAADLKTTGFDLTLGWKKRINKVNWGINFILSDNTAEITKYSNPKGLINDYYKGKKIGDIWGLVTAGIFQTDEEAKALDQKNISSRVRAAGDLFFEDLNGDGKISYGSSTLDDPGDRKIIGNSNPRYSYGIKSNIEWKGFDIDIFFQGVGKRDVIIDVDQWLSAWYNEWYFRPKVILDYWTPENTDAYFPKPMIKGCSDVIATQTRFLQNGAYLRLKQLTFGYTLPVNLTQKIRSERIRVYFTGNNIWELNNIYKNFIDSEMSTLRYTPMYRSFSLGVNINF